VANKITVLIDVVTDKASTSLRNFKTDLANTEGSFGKLKVAGAGAMDFMRVHAAEFAVGAGAALVGFAAKAVTEFQGLALEAGKFKDATGLAIEDASRWIDVGGGLGIGADTIEKAIIRMNIAIGQGRLKEFEADIIRAKDGTVDASATFENLIVKIGAIEDPTKRAAAAQEAFGRGFKDIAELMELDAADLRAALEGVSDAKIIDEGELGKAREFREKMGELKDKAEDLALTLGETLLPVVVDVADVAIDLGEALGGVAEVAGQWLGDDSFLGKAFGHGDKDLIAAGLSAKELKEQLIELSTWSDTTGASLAASTFEARAAGDAMVSAEDRARGYGAAVNELGEEVVDTTREFKAMKSGVDELNSALKKRDAFDAWIAAQDELKVAAEEAWAAAQSGAEDSAEKQATYNEKVRASIEATLDYIGTLGDIPASQTTRVEALIDAGKLVEAEALLQELVRQREARVRVRVITPGGGGFFDSGGHIPAGQSGIVAEKRPEFVNGVLVAGPANVTGGAQTASILNGAGNGVADAIGPSIVFAPQISAMDASSFSPAFIQRLMNEFERTMQRTGRIWQRQG